MFDRVQTETGQHCFLPVKEWSSAKSTPTIVGTDSSSQLWLSLQGINQVSADLKPGTCAVFWPSDPVAPIAKSPLFLMFRIRIYSLATLIQTSFHTMKTCLSFNVFYGCSFLRFVQSDQHSPVTSIRTKTSHSPYHEYINIMVTDHASPPKASSRAVHDPFNLLFLPLPGLYRTNERSSFMSQGRPYLRV